MTEDARLSAPSAQRNRDAILGVLRAVLAASGTVVEVASGSGEHVAHFAQALPGINFVPSDPDPTRRSSIDAWASGIANIRPALALDATSPWPDLSGIAAVVCINMIHIAPWAATQGLLHHAAAVLLPGGALVLYGPFRRGAEPLVDSNAGFDADLRSRDPAWGIRDLDAVARVAAQEGFGPPAVTAMPANNLCVVFRTQA